MRPKRLPPTRSQLLTLTDLRRCTRRHKLGKQAVSASRLNACVSVSQGALRIAKGITHDQPYAVEECQAGSYAPKVTTTGTDRDPLSHHADAGSRASEPFEAMRLKWQ